MQNEEIKSSAHHLAPPRPHTLWSAQFGSVLSHQVTSKITFPLFITPLGSSTQCALYFSNAPRPSLHPPEASSLVGG